MIDLQTLPADEAERIAYTEGYTGTAALFAKIADLEADCDKLAYEKTQILEQAESLRDTLRVALAFVEDHATNNNYAPEFFQNLLGRIQGALGEERTQ
jgi:citrate synthase